MCGRTLSKSDKGKIFDIWLTMPNQSWLYANCNGHLIKIQERVDQLFYTLFEDRLFYLYYPKQTSGSVMLAQVSS